MNFARFSGDCDVYAFEDIEGYLCDVYAFEDVDGYLVCCGCILRDPQAFRDGVRIRYGCLGPTICHNRTELVEHMRAHQAAGHLVPEDVIDRILRDDP